ncbi:hypothetical protein P168DRAFT_306124 [Aspergillus campestris IBT 28561]|uniref:Uncharacterized protein n=1 Tax=Aspergillus campestris (strain IBT 28561) TaxID=1392248 RepID=A0A2I1CW78_ASPC2|nr:uncharacterized protein P168DRAFT_306124 [Aspergillus campestris IBT 28561]PKY01868.1 hypothetical protein P168DRAFT_306124 [Aspergillus campestris IBT 28561]
MHPPSNSILHHMHKLSEAARTRRARTVNRQDTRPPPPPYTPREKEDDRVDVDDNDDDDIDEEDYDDEFDEYNEEESNSTCFHEKTTSSSRVTLHIDASISISGDRNTIILPCRPSFAPSTTPPTTTGSSLATPSPIGTLHSLQRQQQPKLASLATEIISAALQDRRRIYIPSNGRGQPSPVPLPPAPPVDVKIDVGVKVRGSGNVVCLGAKAGGPVRKRRQEMASSGEVMGGRKRRAQSEPCDMPRTKRV